MRIVAYRNDRPREHRIFRSLADGAQALGIDFEVRRKGDYGKGRKYDGPDSEADAIIVYGVKSRDLLKEHHNSGCNWIILDKGYIRRSGPHGVELYTRASVNETYPLHAISAPGADKPSDRWDRLEIEMKRLRKPTSDGHILLAGSSQKFYDYFGCGNERRFHAKMVRRIKRFTERRIHYRPKPSYEKRTGEGEELLTLGAARFSSPYEKIADALVNAHVLVTFASNAACDALFSGVPAITLGPHISNPVAGDSLSLVNNPPFPEKDERYRWACKLAYEQWTLEEMRSGEMWEYLLPRVEDGPLDDEWYTVKQSDIGWALDESEQ